MGIKINKYIADKPGTLFRGLKVLADIYRLVNSNAVNILESHLW